MSLLIRSSRNIKKLHLKNVETLMKLQVFSRKMCTVQFSNLKYKNPCLDLQQYLDIPIFKDIDHCFDPSIESMRSAEKLFLPINNNIKCISRTIKYSEFPNHDLPEVAFLGRSNAGKSSLLKAIFCEIPELRIKTSKTPGMTKSLNFYEVGTNLCLVDMPGYGIRQPKWFESSVGYYLKNRRNLVKAFLLIDGKESFQDWDDAAFQMLDDLKVPFAIILTKIDAVPDSQRLRNFLHLQKIKDYSKSNICFPQVFMLSSQTLEGMAFFMSFIAHITGNEKSPESKKSGPGQNEKVELPRT